MDKTNKTTKPTLNWIRRLPEAGTVRELVTREEELIQRIADAKQAVRDAEAALKGHRKAAIKAINRQWTREEIAEATFQDENGCGACDAVTECLCR